MKNNAPRNSIFNCRCPLSVLLLGVVLPHAQVNADVPPPPPVQHQNAGFPSAQKLEQMGYNRETGVWKVQTNPTGKPTVSSGGGQITGTQGQRVTVTDGYGNNATVNTQVNQRVNTGRVEMAIGGTLAGLSAAGGAIGSDYAAWAYRDIKAGDWGDAARNSVGALLSGLASLDITGLGSGINNFLDKTGLRNNSSGQQLGQIAAQQQAAQAQAEKSGNYQKALGHAAAAKAAKAAAAQQQKKENLQRQEKSGKNVILVRFHEWGGGEAEIVEWKSYETSSGSSRQDIGNFHLYEVKYGISYKYSDDLTISYSPRYTGKYGRFFGMSIYPNTQLNRENFLNNNSVDINGLMLTQKEMLDILKRMLENNQTNHAELMNQLAKMGNVVPSSTTSTEFTPATATTAPYTPLGSNTPQQTQVTINKDGSVTTSVIPRPDLVPNSPQAPTRSPLIPNNPSTPTTPTSPTSPTSPTTPTTPTSPNNPSTPDNPTVPNKPKEDQPPQENTAYEDPNIPTQTVDLDFKPADIFSVDGVCPEPRSVDFGMFGQHEFSYDPLCDFARKIRPILILITIVSCSFFVYSSLKD